MILHNGAYEIELIETDGLYTGAMSDYHEGTVKNVSKDCSMPIGSVVKFPPSRLIEANGKFFVFETHLIP
jgi:hypothetical protein